MPYVFLTGPSERVMLFGTYLLYWHGMDYSDSSPQMWRNICLYEVTVAFVFGFLCYLLGLRGTFIDACGTEWKQSRVGRIVGRWFGPKEESSAMRMDLAEKGEIFLSERNEVSYRGDFHWFHVVD
ncbi:hypothetical protein DL95DRAFT_384995, partial [Leptodontidium sp. 2 PMI_412]